MSENISPIFLYSLPRSGSTLLQRMLADNPVIATASEPWFLLPIVYSTKSSGVYAEYSHFCVPIALEDLTRRMKNGVEDYYLGVRNMAESVYGSMSPNNEKYFLDKTPRYSLICHEINKIFPRSKRIYLWRHPLDTVSSVSKTFLNGRMRLFHYYVDLYKGLESLVKEYEADKGNSDVVVSIRYEDLVSNVEYELGRIGKIFPREHNVGAYGKLIEVPGRMGDPWRDNKYNGISQESLNGWKTFINNPVRKWWCKKYIEWIGPARMAIMGYSYQETMLEIDSVEVSLRGVVRDISDIAYGVVYRVFEFKILKDKFLRKKIMKHD